MEEIWKDIEGFNGRFAVSNKGRVLSKARYINRPYGKTFKEDYILKPHKNHKGYLAGDLDRKKNGNLSFSVIEPWVWEIDGVKYKIRIRKLIPRECFRLMSFTDEDFDKVESVISNTQLYKAAGDSICENVLKAIFSNLF